AEGHRSAWWVRRRAIARPGLETAEWIGRSMLGGVGAARGALRGLAAPERFGDERIGEDKPRFGHVLDRKRYLGSLAGGDIVAAQAGTLPVNPEEQAAESPPPVDRGHELDLDLMARKSLEIRAPHQRPVE